MLKVVISGVRSMAEILKRKAGSKVTSTQLLLCFYEGFEVGENHITANVGIDKIKLPTSFHG